MVKYAGEQSKAFRGFTSWSDCQKLIMIRTFGNGIKIGNLPMKFHIEENFERRDQIAKIYRKRYGTHDAGETKTESDESQ